jgi:tRNA modification GTPase
LNQNSQSDGITLVSKYQISSVEKTLSSIHKAKTMLEDIEFEFFAYEINEALESISQITQAYEHSQMLDVMFGEFCLGK